MAILEGQSTDTTLYDACSTSYANYVYNANICTADKMPVHPTNPSFVATTPIVSAETRPNTECCSQASATATVDP